jgi:predicted XRE-type DNA-binding protein
LGVLYGNTAIQHLQTPSHRNGNHHCDGFWCRIAPRATETSAMRTPDPIPALKKQLAQEIVDRLDGWDQVYAADFLGTDQPRMSDLRSGRLDRFSLEKLIRFITRDHGTVTLRVTWKSRWHRLRDQRRPSPRTPRPGATPSTKR